MSHRYDDGYDDDTVGEKWGFKETAALLIAAGLAAMGLAIALFVKGVGA